MRDYSERQINMAAAREAPRLDVSTPPSTSHSLQAGTCPATIDQSLLHIANHCLHILQPFQAPATQCALVVHTALDNRCSYSYCLPLILLTSATFEMVTTSV